MAFGSLADVDAWMTEEGNNPERLWELVKSGDMAGDNAKWGKVWLSRHAAKQDEKHSQEVLDLTRRTTKANEDSAKAARASAVSAAIAIGISLVSVTISVAALWKQ